MQDEIAELQMKVAFQESTIDALNDALASQQAQLDKLHFQMKHIIGRMKQLQPSDIASASEETPPPHY